VQPQRDYCDVNDQIGALADVEGNFILQLIGAPHVRADVSTRRLDRARSSAAHL
jgi:hypothetical protein